MEKSVSQKIRLGVLVVVGTFFFLLAVYLIGSKQSMFGNTIHLNATFKNVNGLLIGNNVRFAGINIGTVTDIKMISDSVILVDIIVDKKMTMHIKSNSIATISTDGLVGNMIINILPMPGNYPAVVENSTIMSSKHAGTDEMLSTLSVTNQNAALMSANLLKITDQIVKGQGVVGRLLTDTMISEQLVTTFQNLHQSTKKANEIMKNINTLVQSINNKSGVAGFLQDTSVATKMNEIMANVNVSVQNLNKVVNNLDATVLNAKDGKGAINYLSNDRSLVRTIDKTSHNLDSIMYHFNDASVKLNEILEALKHNFLVRGYFKKKKE